jgi:hypothetical protein
LQEWFFQADGERMVSGFRAGLNQRFVVSCFHAVGGFGSFFTAELVCSTAKPPTAFSTIHGTFPLRGQASRITPISLNFTFLQLISLNYA